jgi:hypothetical protein
VALPVTFAVFLVGLIIEKVKDKYGIISAIILHMGLDFSIVIVIADLLKQGIINKGL